MQRESITNGCDLLHHLPDSTSPRIRRARRACAGNLFAQFFFTSTANFRYVVKRVVQGHGVDGELNQRFDRDRTARLTWDDVDAVFAGDESLRAKAAGLAVALGYADAAPYVAEP